MNKRIGFYCSGGASRVLKFYSKKENSMKYKPLFVIYDGNRKEVQDALQSLLPDTLVVSLSAVGQPKPNQFISDELLKLAVTLHIDYIFCFGERILKKSLLDHYKNKIINFHPSLLPSFPGLNSIDQALKTSVAILGNTAHFVDSGIDTGPIIMQSVLPRNSYKDYEDVLSLQLPMLKQIWNWLEEDMIKIDNKGIVRINDDNHASVLFSPNIRSSIN